MLAADLLHHLLDQEVAERDPSEPALTVGDRIEHRRGRLAGFDRLAVYCEDWIDRAGNLAGQRDLDEDQRIVDQRRVEEGVAAPVRRVDAPAQVVPAVDAMHRFVTDDPFQDARGRRPVDAPQDQKAAVEPGGEEMDEIRIHDAEIVAMIHGVDDLLAHMHERGGAVGREVKPAEQFLPQRFGSEMDVGGGRIGRRPGHEGRRSYWPWRRARVLSCEAR